MENSESNMQRLRRLRPTTDYNSRRISARPFLETIPEDDLVFKQHRCGYKQCAMQSTKPCFFCNCMFCSGHINFADHACSTLSLDTANKKPDAAIKPSAQGRSYHRYSSNTVLFYQWGRPRRTADYYARRVSTRPRLESIPKDDAYHASSTLAINFGDKEPDSTITPSSQEPTTSETIHQQANTGARAAESQ